MKKRTKGRSATSRRAKESEAKQRASTPVEAQSSHDADTTSGRKRQGSTKPAATEPNVRGSAERIYAFADQLNEARRKKDQEKVEERPESWVSFALGEETYSLPVAAVHEILRVGQITRVPHAPTSVLGVCNRRGRVLPVVDLRIRLGLEPSPATPASRIMVVASDGRLLGLLVDSVRQVEGIRRSRMQSPPESVAAVAAGAVQGVVEQEGRMIVLLELASLLQLGQAGGEKIA